VLGEHEGDVAAGQLVRRLREDHRDVHRDTGEQQRGGLPVQWQEQADLLRTAEPVDEQVGGLGDPVGGGGAGDLDPAPTWETAVVQRQERLRRVALADQAAGEVGQAAQGSSSAVTTFGLALTDGVVAGAEPVTVTGCAPL
jgi:hypothetical protein